MGKRVDWQILYFTHTNERQIDITTSSHSLMPENGCKIILALDFASSGACKRVL